MPFIGNKPSAVPLTSADIADGIITSAKIVDATIANADIANSTIDLTTKVTGTLPTTKGGTGLAALGTSLQVLRTNTGATALEFATLSTGATAGQIIQVVGATDTTSRNTTSTSYVTGSNTLSVSITPSSASNKIFILCSVSLRAEDGVENRVTLYRGGSNILGANGFGYQYGSSSSAKTGVQGMSYLDSPSSTSSLTYQIYFKSSGGGIELNDFNGTASITAFEIKG